MSPSLYPPGKLPPEDLERLIRTYGRPHPSLVVPPAPGEDAAVIDFGGERYLVAKTDPITFAGEQIGWYAVHVNANDIAAMGARPQFFLATLLLPPDQATPEGVESIFRSIREAVDALGIVLCGGHTEITPAVRRPIVVGQMLGAVAPGGLVRSSGLRAGDELVLSKGLGIEATALIAREKRRELMGRGCAAELLARSARFLRRPGISVVRDAGIALEHGQIHALHDPTEGGVATGLAEMAAASGVGLEIDAGALPIAPETARLCAEFGLDPLGILSSGALLIGCAAAAPVVEALHRAGIVAARIGVARPPEAGLHLRRGGRLEPLPRFAADEFTRLFED